jgi:tRNA dimethylallyltransferase
LDDLPESDPNLKNQLTQILNEHGIEKLQSKLYELDPAFYQSIDLQNPHRLIRAIEVCMLTGKKFSDLRLGNKKQNSFRLVKIGLNLPRENLYERINLRVHKMLLDGLLEEAESLYKFRALKALKTVGYSELFDFLENKNTLEDAVQLIQQNSRRYAKRQLTWFRKDQEVQWFDSARFDEIKAFLEQKI